MPCDLFSNARLYFQSVQFFLYFFSFIADEVALVVNMYSSKVRQYVFIYDEGVTAKWGL